MPSATSHAPGHLDPRVTQPTPGQRVRMCSTAYVGRQGTVAGTQQIETGGRQRLAVLVDLDATPRAKARRIRCYPASYVLETR